MNRNSWVRGCWVGWLIDGRYVVFDPSTPNLYRHDPKFQSMHDDIRRQATINDLILSYLKYSEMGYDHKGQVALWVYPEKRRDYFDRKEIRQQLSNEKIERMVVERIGNAYLRWKLKGTGAQNINEYDEMVALANERANALLNGEEPIPLPYSDNSKYVPWEDNKLMVQGYGMPEDD